MEFLLRLYLTYKDHFFPFGNWYFFLAAIQVLLWFSNPTPKNTKWGDLVGWKKRTRIIAALFFLNRTNVWFPTVAIQKGSPQAWHEINSLLWYAVQALPTCSEAAGNDHPIEKDIDNINLEQIRQAVALLIQNDLCRIFMTNKQHVVTLLVTFPHWCDAIRLPYLLYKNLDNDSVEAKMLVSSGWLKLAAGFGSLKWIGSGWNIFFSSH